MISQIHPARSPRLLAAVLAIGFAPVLLAQAPEAAIEPTPSVTREQAVAALGDSPVASLLDALGADTTVYYQHVTTLSNPFFEGRAPGLAGNRRAAEYIEFEFRRLGLKPAFAAAEVAHDGTEVLTPNQSFRQPFNVGSRTSLGQCSVRIVPGTGDGTTLVRDTDYSVLDYSGTGAASGSPVFVGYAIEDGQGDYSSFPAGTDLTGRIALVLRYEPMDENGKSKWAENGWSVAAELGTKIKAAADKGAAAVLLVNPPGADDPRARRLMTGRGRGGGETLDIPVVMLAEDDADALVRAGDTEGRGLLDLRNLADESGVIIDLPNAQVAVKTEVKREPIETDNVGAALEGKGPLAGEYLVIGAHYDHVGYGEGGGAAPGRRGELHPGADDNASGTSGLLMIADKLKSAYAALPPDASARSVIFLAFSAEETGLIGSRHYARQPSVARDRIALMLNMDMIGRLRGDSLEVGGVNTAEGMEEWIKPMFAASGFEIKPSTVGDGRSDHASFIREQIPALFFFTGLHREYHTPEDVASLINPVGAVRVVNLVKEIALAAAQRPDRFVFTDPSAARRAAASPPSRAAPTGDASRPAPTGVRVRFGIAPGNYNADGQGIQVSDVYEKTPAAEAGLKKGDVMKKWNGTDLTSVEKWMELLAQHRPGDQVEIQFARDGKDTVTYCVLKARDSGDQ